MKQRLLLSLILAAMIVSFLVLAIRTEPGQGAGARQTWEYKVLEFTRTAGLAGNELIFREDGRDIPFPGRVTIRANELGAQGWELASVVAGTGSGAGWYTYFFKRPK